MHLTFDWLKQHGMEPNAAGRRILGQLDTEAKNPMQ
jgi:hypothetical protein